MAFKETELARIRNVGGFLILAKAFYDIEMARGAPSLVVHVSRSAPPSKPGGELALVSKAVALACKAEQTEIRAPKWDSSFLLEA